MKISSKTRYAIAVLMLLYAHPDKPLSLSDIAKQLGLSKLYLEQVIAALKSHQMVQSIKGPQGGYYLQRKDLNLLDIFKAVDPDQVKLNEETAFEDMRLNQILIEQIYQPLLTQTEAFLGSITLTSLVDAYQGDVMFFI